MVQLKTDLAKMNASQRTKLREKITNEIINDLSERLVIVSGPGTGKSHLFLKKIKFILKQNPNAKILITTFVAKLSKELNDKIQNDPEVGSKKEQILSKTLHATAYEMLKKSPSFVNHFQVIEFAILKNIWLDIIKICEAERIHIPLIIFNTKLII